MKRGTSYLSNSGLFLKTSDLRIVSLEWKNFRSIEKLLQQKKQKIGGGETEARELTKKIHLF